MSEDKVSERKSKRERNFTKPVKLRLPLPMQAEKVFKVKKEYQRATKYSLWDELEQELREQNEENY